MKTFMLSLYLLIPSTLLAQVKQIDGTIVYQNTTDCISDYNYVVGVLSSPRVKRNINLGTINPNIGAEFSTITITTDNRVINFLIIFENTAQGINLYDTTWTQLNNKIIQSNVLYNLEGTVYRTCIRRYDSYHDEELPIQNLETVYKL